MLFCMHLLLCKVCHFCCLNRSEVAFIPTLFIFGFKVTQICKILLFCLGDLYFQTVDILRGRVTTDIIVIYIFLFPWSQGWVWFEILLKYILHNSKTISLHVCINFVLFFFFFFFFLYLQITYYISTTLIAILGYRFEKSLRTFF